MITRDISGVLSCPGYDSATGKMCFFCGEAVQNPAVMWHGLDGNDHITNIYLHPHCIIDWYRGLMRDYCELHYPPEKFTRRPVRRSNGAPSPNDASGPSKSTDSL